MAVLGAQLVFSLVIFSFLQKLACFYSFGRWLLAGRLVRYLHPTDGELRKAAGIQPASTSKGKYRRNDGKRGQNNKDEKDETFTIPRSTPITLDMAKVEAIDLVHLHYYGEYIWMMDFAISAIMVYVLTEVYYTFGHWNEMNISVLWCLLGVGFCVRTLFTQMAIYFKGEDGGERMLIITFGFFFLILAMGILVVDESILEFGLQTGYENFSAGANAFLEQQGIESQGPVSLLTFKIILAFLCSLFGALLAFPGLRMAKLHLDALKYSRESRGMQVLLHINFILPLLLLLLWVKPIARDNLCGLHWHVKTNLLSEDTFDSLRIVLFIFMFVLRLMLLSTHLQSHLNSAYEKVEAIRKESGRISNIEVQKTVARVFYFLGVASIQYLTPVIILLFMACLYKTLGDFSWSIGLGDNVHEYVDSFAVTPNATVAQNATGTVVDQAVQFSLAFSSLRKVFTSVWYRGLISFLTWWICAAWSVAMGFGIYYHSRLNQ